MKGISRRATACAVAAVPARSRLPARRSRRTPPAYTGDGVQTGQVSIQLFTHSGFICNGGGVGTRRARDLGHHHRERR